MFTGIIESFGRVISLKNTGSNLDITIESDISNELKVDQSLAHNGVCLTVVDQKNGQHTVNAIQETLDRSNLGALKMGSLINLERAMPMNGRLDGHLVQGHVDATAQCADIQVLDGSWYFTFKYPPEHAQLLVDKGSICVNGVSLTLIQPSRDLFSVAIIPYTFHHTNFNQIQKGSVVNLEFDIIGKYVTRGFEVKSWA